MTSEPTKPSSPHDALFKRTFSNVENAAAELRAVLPPSIVAETDFETLKVVPGSFVNELYSEVHSDLLYEVQVRGRRALVYVLFEHQSTVEPLMPQRLLGYISRVLEHHVEKKGGKMPLPVVLPVVLHHSESGWTRKTDFHSLFDAELLSVDGVAELVPRFEFVLDDISRASDEELMRRAERETARIVPVVLWAMRDARAGERLVASVAAWQGLLQHVWQAPSGRAALVEVFRYISLVGDRLSRDNLIEVAGAAAPDAKEVVMTLAEQWIAEGRAEGRAEGERIVLLRLLRLKFGELPASAQAQVAHANEEQLSLWAERVLTASSLDEVLA